MIGDNAGTIDFLKNQLILLCIFNSRIVDRCVFTSMEVVIIQ